MGIIMKNWLAIVGGGGHCKSVLDSAIRMNCFDRIVITDPNISIGTKIMGFEVVGSDDVLIELKNAGFDMAFITTGSIKSTELRRKLAKEIISIGFVVPNIIDPSAQVSKFVNIQHGIFIGKNAVVNSEAKLGNYSIINTSSIIEHECSIGDYSHIAVGGIICGNVYVGSDSFVGAGTTVIQGVHIGKNVIIGAGSTVISDIPDDCVAVGTPAKPIKCLEK